MRAGNRILRGDESRRSNEQRHDIRRQQAKLLMMSAQIMGTVRRCSRVDPQRGHWRHAAAVRGRRRPLLPSCAAITS